MKVRAICCAAMVTGLVAGVAPAANGSAGRVSGRWDNCTKVNQKYPHGVGRRHAHDHTTGTPVTTFKRSNRLYRIAMSYNSDLDRDKDHIACEKA